MAVPKRESESFLAQNSKRFSQTRVGKEFCEAAGGGPASVLSGFRTGDGG